MYDRVLLPVDGSDEAKRAARRGLELAETIDATIEALYVVERRAGLLARTEEEHRQLRESGEAVLEEIEHLASELGRPLTTTLTEGKPAVRISEHAAERDADLVVVGRQGMTRVGKRLLGGVTEQIIARGEVPVPVVPSDDRGPDGEAAYSRVLLTTDGSENANEAIPHAAAIAASYGANVDVLNVVDLQAAGGAFNAGGLQAEFVERLRERGRDAVDGAAGQIEDAAPGVTVRTAVEQTTAHGARRRGRRHPRVRRAKRDRSRRDGIARTVEPQTPAPRERRLDRASNRRRAGPRRTALVTPSVRTVPVDPARKRV